ncbi:hypothetical protein, partial [Porphyromonas sp.]
LSQKTATRPPRIKNTARVAGAAVLLCVINCCSRCVRMKELMRGEEGAELRELSSLGTCGIIRLKMDIYTIKSEN